MSEWKEDILSKKVDLIHGHQFRDTDFVDDGIPIIKIGQLKFNGQIDLTDCSYIDKKNLEKFKDYLINQGDVLMALTGATLGKTVRVTKDFGIILQNYRVGKFSPIDDTINKDFIYYLLTSSFVQNEMLAKINTAAQGNIGKGDFNRIKIRYPSYKVQHRIANILTTCDSVIEQTQSTIAKYKAIKQGLLHDLFTRGLDANGHLRPNYIEAQEMYKESELGMIPKEWEVKRLGEIATMKSGDGITSAFIADTGDFPVYGGNGLRGFTTTFTHEGDYVLIGRQGALCGNITRVSNKFFASEHAVVVTVNKDIDVDWLSQKLDAMNLNQYSEASAQPGLAVAKILRLYITKPQHNEQKEIGKRLLAIDNKMNAEETLLQKYQSIKRGLMGDLLGGKKNLSNHIEKM